MKVGLICYLYNKKLADLDIKTEDEEVRITIDTLEIAGVREAKEDDEDKPSKIKCVIYLKSGESFWIKRNYDDMVLLWESENYESYIKNKKNL